MATRQVLFIHGGGADAYEADSKLARSLQRELEPDFEVLYPDMNGAAPEYGAWSARISRNLSAMDGKVYLVGHSLGGSILLKHLSEERIEKPIAGVFLIAAPYWGAMDWEVQEFELLKDFAATFPQGIPTFLYHSRDDEIEAFLKERSLLGRVTTLADVGNAAAFLASDLAGATTGTVFNLTSGTVVD